MRRRVLPALAVAGILASALALRLYGLDWDEGFLYTPHPDERAILMKVNDISPPGIGELGSLFDADESPWNPRWFPYGSFTLYLLKGVQLVHSVLPGDDLRDLRVAGRTLSALADVATVVVVLLLGTRMYGRRVGLLAAAFTALAVIHIQLSHFYAVDTLLALFTVAALYFMYRVATEGRPRDSMLAGAFIGLGLATKASQAPIYLAFVAAHLIYLFAMTGRGDAANARLSERWPVALKGLLAGAAASVLVMFIAEPYAFLDRSRFWADFTEQSEMVRRIRDYPYTRQYIDTTPYWYHIKQLATWGLGWPLGIVAWAGLLFVSLRGMRLDHGLGYLLIGWVVPGALMLYSADLKVVLLASSIAFAALMATLPVRSPASRGAVLLLCWVVPYLLIIGAFEVKFLRYVVPTTPLLLLFGAGMLVAIWDWANKALPAARPFLLGALVLLLAVTGAYALSYVSIYRGPHTAVRASQWINENAPKGALILKEHWEESLPGLEGYTLRELPMYERDDAAKFQQVARDLAEADYLVFFSNRLYGTLPRLPELYPVSKEYYRLLFSGELGYELVDLQASYPKLFGVSLVDDTFSRPGVPEPAMAGSLGGPKRPLDLGFADESFTVYDHPKVMVLENRRRYDAETMQQMIENAASYLVAEVQPGPGQRIGLLLSPDEAETQQEGGSWSDIVRVGSWTNRLPITAWLILVEGIALLAFPLGFVIFRPLPDRGYLFSKALGILLVSLVVWLLASLKWMAFSQASISLALVLLAGVSGVMLWRYGREMVDFVRHRWSLLVIAELVFLAAFLAFVLLRMANPDLWHPYRGGEKPMDFAYLNAVLRSTHMPPYDPWFGGGYLNYYYWGQFIVAILIKATGINPGVAYNLAVPLMFALTVAGAYSLVYNMAEATRRSLVAGSQHLARGAKDMASRLSWSPMLAGLGATIFVAVLGNLDGAIQVGQGLWRALFQDLPFGEFDFWRSSRMMPPDPPGFEITEFPFFTFLFADLHAHLVAIPFTLLSLGIGLSVLLGAARGRRRQESSAAEGSWTLGEVARLAALGVAVGSLRVINTWDYPSALVLAVATVFLAGYFRHGGLALASLFDSAVRALFVVVVGYLAFVPFHLANETFFTSAIPLEATTNQTVLWQFLAIHGLFVFVIGSFFIIEMWPGMRPLFQSAFRWFSPAHSGQVLGGSAATLGADAPRVAMGRTVFLVLGVLLVGYITVVAASGPAGSTIPFLVVLAVLVLAVALGWLRSGRADAPVLTYVAALIGMSLTLAIGLDIVRIEGDFDIDRMNSVFKVYLQIWVLLAVASAFLLWRLGYGRRLSWQRMRPGAKMWMGALAVLVLSASIYPVLGTRDRLRDRFNGQVLPLTLDGTAFVEDTVYRDAKGEIDLEADFQGIAWLRENVEGSPVILEGVTPTYRWGGRVSIYTGLPSVVGWRWHQEQQRWGYRWAVGDRIRDVDRLYTTPDPGVALSLIRKYGVRYVYLGQLERLYYPGEGLDKFDGALSEHLDKVFESEQVAIYRVLDQ